MKPRIVPTQHERRFDADEFIVTKTDLKGRITYANRVFMRMSDYAEESLLGVQHNIVRHPDMPRGAFKHLWDTIQTGREWFGFVKNMAANGDFYWVFANVTVDYHNDQKIGYYSVRRQAPQKAVDVIASLYAEMSRIEQAAGPAKACEASLAWLDQQLAAKGVSYEQMMLDLFHRAV